MTHYGTLWYTVAHNGIVDTECGLDMGEEAMRETLSSPEIENG